MQEKLARIKEEALAKLNAAGTMDTLNEIRLAYLGKKGELTEVLKGMRDVAPEDRPKVGEWVNSTRKAIEERLASAQKEIAEKALEARLKAETVDVTLPAKLPEIGHRHPNTLALEELERVFIGMGYEVVEGPEVETVFLLSSPELAHVSSSAVREMAAFGADFGGYVPDEIVTRVRAHFTT